jgi:hypothetical protein
MDCARLASGKKENLQALSRDLRVVMENCTVEARMKGILCACLLVSLQLMSSARAYEADIHFSTTFVIARALGWPEAEAVIIASANQAMDENQETVAALEADAIPRASFAGFVASSFRQAEKNLRFHCFSNTPAKAGPISSDVRKVISGHFAAVPHRNGDANTSTRRLIALGVALHCQQDAYSHAEFGGSCGPYAGSCLGHAYETLLDKALFSLLGKHHYDPDHPGVSGERLLEALQGTASELAARRPGGSSRAIPADKLAALSDALRSSGLELPDDVRRECNRYIAGKWLFGFTHSGTVETLAPEAAVTCRNAALGPATIVRIPDPRLPRLKADASPQLVRGDGTYEQVRGGDFEVSLPGSGPNYFTQEAKMQLSHWKQLIALPLMVQAGLF